MTVLSVLDLSPIIEGGDAAQALNNSLDLARQTERMGYNRYWVAEHHNMRGIASAATSVVIGHIAQGTERIRVGAGGIMLPNHSPLQIAEQFGTLEALYPGRIDLGLGRAPGTDGITAQALRRTLHSDPNKFPQDVLELKQFLADPEPNQRVQAVPGYGAKVPLYILGSSLFGAQLAAILGLPFAFASHFAPQAMMQAIEIYRREFSPSDQLAEPYVILGYNVCAADTEAEALLLRSSGLQAFLNLRFGNPGPLPAPKANLEASLTSDQQAVMAQISSAAAVGTPEQVRDQIFDFVAQTAADELIITSQIFDHAARVRSYELTYAAVHEAPPQAAAMSGS
ncbi:MAG: LLM class flavin-dependent oxidoreductase [Pseudomonadota bacterium]